VELPCDILDNEPGADNEKLMNLYQKYGFKVWFKQLGGVESSVTTPVVKSMTLPIVESNPEVSQTGVCQSDWLKEYTQNTVFTQDSFETLVKRLSACKRFVFDLETDSLDYMNGKIVGWVFLVDKAGFDSAIGKVIDLTTGVVTLDSTPPSCLNHTLKPYF
jgi:DNA polymerase-1